MNLDNYKWQSHVSTETSQFGTFLPLILWQYCYHYTNRNSDLGRPDLTTGQVTGDGSGPTSDQGHGWSEYICDMAALTIIAGPNWSLATMVSLGDNRHVK